MGLIGDTINDFVVEPVENVWNSTVGEATNTETTVSDKTTEVISNTEDSFNDGAQTTADTVESTFDLGSDGVFGMIRGGVDTVEGLFNSIAGAFEWSKGFADLPVVKDSPVAPAWDFVAEGGVGLFHAIAGVFSFLEGFFAFLGTLNGWESTGFLLGALLLFLGIYMLVTSFGLQIFESGIMSFLGTGLIIWSSSNLQGAAILLGTGVILIAAGILADRMSFIAFGIPAYVVGSPLLFAALKVGAMAVILLTIASLILLIYGLMRLETDISFRLAMEESKGPGLFKADKAAKQYGSQVVGVFRRSGA